MSQAELLRQDMLDQPRALRTHRSQIAAAVAVARAVTQNRPREPVLTGVGTSLFAWRGAEWALLKANRHAPWVVDTAELLDFGPPAARDQRPVFVMSRSGESAEIARLMRALPPVRPVVAITETVESPLGRRAQHVLPFSAHEQAFANTKSFLLSMAYALACAQGMGASLRVSPTVWVDEAATAIEVLLETAEHSAKVIAGLLSQMPVAALVGRGWVTGVIDQAVLDLHEGVRLAAIPVRGSLFRHGSIELTVRPDVLTIVLIPADRAAHLGRNLVRELHRRQAPVVAVASKGVRLDPGVPVLEVPRVWSPLIPLVFAVAMEMILLQLIQAVGQTGTGPSLVEKVTRQE